MPKARRFGAYQTTSYIKPFAPTVLVCWQAFADFNLCFDVLGMCFIFFSLLFLAIDWDRG